MVKINIFGLKGNAAVAVTLILAAAVIAGCVGTKAPQTQLDFSARAASGLIITNKGGESMALKDEKITVTREVDGKVVDGLNAIPLYGNTPEFQDAPVIETLVPGQKIKHVWKEPLSIGEVLIITLQDEPSGKVIVNTKVTVT